MVGGGVVLAPAAGAAALSAVGFSGGGPVAGAVLAQIFMDYSLISRLRTQEARPPRSRRAGTVVQLALDPCSRLLKRPPWADLGGQLEEFSLGFQPW